MKNEIRLIWSFCAIVVLLLVSVGLILPPLISTNLFPAWLIVVLCGLLLGAVSCFVLFFISGLNQT